MTDLKVVQDWLEMARSCSRPCPLHDRAQWEASRDLGSYATAELDRSSLLGVIAIQTKPQRSFSS